MTLDVDYAFAKKLWTNRENTITDLGFKFAPQSVSKVF